MELPVCERCPNPFLPEPLSASLREQLDGEMAEQLQTWYNRNKPKQPADLPQPGSILPAVELPQASEKRHDQWNERRRQVPIESKHAKQQRFAAHLVPLPPHKTEPDEDEEDFETPLKKYFVPANKTTH